MTFWFTPQVSILIPVQVSRLGWSIFEAPCFLTGKERARSKPPFATFPSVFEHETAHEVALQPTHPSRQKCESRATLTLANPNLWLFEIAKSGRFFCCTPAFSSSFCLIKEGSPSKRMKRAKRTTNKYPCAHSTPEARQHWSLRRRLRWRTAVRCCARPRGSADRRFLGGSWAPLGRTKARRGHWQRRLSQPSGF